VTYPGDILALNSHGANAPVTVALGPATIRRSRGQNRSWCGMRECGNRVNAAAYRKRQRQKT
jgi:CGNR zinc finger